MKEKKKTKEVKKRYDLTLTPSRVRDAKKRHKKSKSFSKLVDDLLLITLYDYTDS